MESLIGQTLGQYQIVEPLGQGGMATVYKAYQARLNRYVAIKILPADCPPDSRFARRFTREAQALALLDHPNILPVYDFGQQGEISYLVMKYVPGGPLSKKLGRPLPLFEALIFIECLASALDEAHAHGIVHCDVTPRNILLDERGWPYLTDFGLSRIVDTPPATVTVNGTNTPAAVNLEPAHPLPSETSPNLMALGGILFDMLTQPRYEGTPTYMSPEQGQGLSVSVQTDVYALGIILFEMLTGRVPYEAETEMGIVLKQITAPLPRPRQFNPAISEATEQIILKALAKNPADRFASAGALAAALRLAIHPLDGNQSDFSDQPIPKAALQLEADSTLSKASALSRDWIPSLARGVWPRSVLIGIGIATSIGLCLLGILFYIILKAGQS